MTDNPELPDQDGAIEDALIEIAIAIRSIRDRAYPLEGPAPRVADWPWAPGTLAQGFLAARWNRRDGNSYATPAPSRAAAPNSPIRGGDDSQKIIDVPSGARRS